MAFSAGCFDRPAYCFKITVQFTIELLVSLQIDIHRIRHFQQFIQHTGRDTAVRHKHCFLVIRSDQTRGINDVLIRDHRFVVCKGNAKIVFFSQNKLCQLFR